MLILQITLEERIRRANDRADERLKNIEKNDAEKKIADLDVEVQSNGDLLGGKQKKSQQVDEYVSLYEESYETNKLPYKLPSQIVSPSIGAYKTKQVLDAGLDTTMVVKAASKPKAVKDIKHMGDLVKYPAQTKEISKFKAFSKGLKMGKFAKCTGIASLVIEPACLYLEYSEWEHAEGDWLFNEIAENHGLSYGEEGILIGELGCNETEFMKLNNMQFASKIKKYKENLLTTHNKETVDKKIANITLARDRRNAIIGREKREFIVGAIGLGIGLAVGAAICIAAAPAIFTGLAIVGTCLAIGGAAATITNWIWSGKLS